MPCLSDDQQIQAVIATACLINMYKCSGTYSTQHVFTSWGSRSVIIINRLDPADCKVCLVPPRDVVTALLTPHKSDRVQWRLRGK